MLTKTQKEIVDRNSHLRPKDLAEIIGCSVKSIEAFLKVTPTKQIQLDHNGRTHIKRGKRADLDNVFFRSAWEANWARYLNFLKEKGEIKSWRYEPKDREFWFPIKRGTRSYLPDFEIEELDGTIVFHEIKGWMDSTSKTKLKRMAKYHPLIKIEIIDGPAYRAVAKQVSKIIPHWE